MILAYWQRRERREGGDFFLCVLCGDILRADWGLRICISSKRRGILFPLPWLSVTTVAMPFTNPLGLRLFRRRCRAAHRVAPVRLCDGLTARRLGSATTKRSGDSNEIEPVILVGPGRLGRSVLEVGTVIRITQMRIWLAVEPVDFRKGIDGLSHVRRQHLRVDPMAGALVVFRVGGARR